MASCHSSAMTTPAAAADPVWRQPAEWEAHDACWLAWPSHPDEWPGALDGVRRAVAEMAAGLARGERVEMLVLPGESEESARRALDGVAVRFHSIPFGDVWLRDTGPIFMAGGGELGAARFEWNGWGGKYHFAHDSEVGDRIAAAAGVQILSRTPMVLEGGAIEVDGEGTLLTTRQCLLAPTRNPGMKQADIEARLAAVLGARKVLWLDRGLANDHTDGHIDTLVRFVAPARVVCMEPSGPGDPNRDALSEIAATWPACATRPDARSRWSASRRPGASRPRPAIWRRPATSTSSSATGRCWCRSTARREIARRSRC